jgi:hypothetical protein
MMTTASSQIGIAQASQHLTLATHARERFFSLRTMSRRWVTLFLLTRPTQVVPELVGLAIICTVIGAFATRMAVVVFGLRSPPFGRRKG